MRAALASQVTSPASSSLPNPLALLDTQLRSASEIERTARTVAASATAAPLATAVPALDELLAGGLPRGQLVEMVGARSSGRFSAVLAAIAAATMAGEAAALVDLGDGLDPQAAADLGVDLRRLLWVRPMNLKQALAGAEIVIGGGFQLVALDLGSPPVRGGRGGEAGWLRLARAAQVNGAALLVATPYRMSGTAASIVLQAARERTFWQGSQDRPGRKDRQRWDRWESWDRSDRSKNRQGSPGGYPWLFGGLSCEVELEKCRGSLLAAGHRCRQMSLRLPGTIPRLDSPLSAEGSLAPSENRRRRARRAW